LPFVRCQARHVRARDLSDVRGEGPRILLWSREFLLGEAIFISATKSITLTPSARLRKLDVLVTKGKATTKYGKDHADVYQSDLPIETTVAVGLRNTNPASPITPGLGLARVHWKPKRETTL